MMDRHYNIMLMFFSGYSEDRRRGFVPVDETTEYILENGERMAAYQTNEAPLYSVAKLLADKGEKLDAIYCLTTEKADEKVRLEDGTTMANPLGYWVATVKRRCPELDGLAVERVRFRYSSQNDLYEKDPGFDFAAISQEYVLKMAGQIRKDLREKNISYEDCNMYVDLTGGFRPAALILSAAVELLQYDGLRLGDVLYADWKGGRALNKVCSFTGVSNLYKLVAGADEFFRYGSSSAINEYFGYTGGVFREGTSPELKALLSAMNDFSEVMQLCQSGRVQSSIASLGSALDVFLSKDEGELPGTERPFRQMASTLREGYKGIIPEGESTATPASIIAWCTKNNLLQQALTFSTEWLSHFLFDEKISYPPRSCWPGLMKCIDNKDKDWKQNYIIEPYAVLRKFQEIVDNAVKDNIIARWERDEVHKICCHEPNLRAYLEGVYWFVDLLKKDFTEFGEAMAHIDGLKARNMKAWRYVELFVKEHHIVDDCPLEASLARKLCSQPERLINRMGTVLQDKPFQHRKRDKNGKKRGEYSPLKVCGFNFDCYKNPPKRPDDFSWEHCLNLEWEENLLPYWKKMFYDWEMALTVFDKEKAIECLKTYFYLRKIRNRINHATVKDTFSKEKVRFYLENFIKAEAALHEA